MPSEPPFLASLTLRTLALRRVMTGGWDSLSALQDKPMVLPPQSTERFSMVMPPVQSILTQPVPPDELEELEELDELDELLELEELLEEELLLELEALELEELLPEDPEELPPPEVPSLPLPAFAITMAGIFCDGSKT